MKKGQKLRVEKPKQYKQGWTEFYKLKFFLTPDSLIPRPETELLVDEIIALAKTSSYPEERTGDEGSQVKTLLDIGTGSGNIAISVAKNLPGVKIFATDISEKALEVAQKNADFHKVKNQIFFIKSDLLEYLASHLSGGIVKVPDIIVTNLPYIPTARLLYIDPMVTEWEPKIALDGGEDGFGLYRKLFAQIAGKKLFPRHFIVEIDYTQADLVLQESRRFFPKAEVEVKHDLAKKQRYFVIKF